jgi:hypothetical protein
VEILNSPFKVSLLSRNLFSETFPKEEELLPELMVEPSVLKLLDTEFSEVSSTKN